MISPTGDHVISRWLTYIPKLFYRDVVPVADPYNATDLRTRDWEIFTAHGMFCRHVVPGEFHAEAMARLGADSYVVVEFINGRWERQLGEHDGTPRPMGSTSIKPRRRSTGRRRS